MKRKTRKRKGGNPDIFYYASFIKNKKEFNTDKFKKMLDKIQNPLYQLYDFDGAIASSCNFLYCNVIVSHTNHLHRRPLLVN